MTINEFIHNHILKQVGKGGSWDGLGRFKLDFDPALNIDRVSFSNPNPTLDPKKPDEMRVEGTGAGTGQWAGPRLVHPYLTTSTNMGLILSKLRFRLQLCLRQEEWAFLEAV